MYSNGNHEQLQYASTAAALDLPIELVTSALAHVCHLVDSVAAVLNIPLPHPLKPFDNFTEACIAPNGVFNASHRSVLYPLTQAHRIAGEPTGDFSWDSIASLSSTTSNDSDKPSSLSPSSAHDHGKGSAKTVKSSNTWSVRPYFVSAFVLLRADVLALCLRAGIAPEMLFPSEAILLNLYLLHRAYIDHTKAASMESYFDPSIMLDVSSKECERALSDRYRSRRWMTAVTTSTSHMDKSQELDASPVNLEYFFDDARIVSTVADWAVVDIEKPVIT
jgi:hypothetical protein